MPAVRGEFHLVHAASIIVLVIVVHSLSYSQINQVPTLLHVQEFTQQPNLRFPHFLNYSSQLRKDIAGIDVHTGKILIVLNNADGSFSGQKQIDSVGPVSSLTTGNLNTDGIDDIVAIQRERNQAIVFLSNKADSSYTKQIFTVNFYPENALLQDISGDRIPDIVVYGKLSSGVTVFPGKGRNGFGDARTIFTDFPVSALSVIRSNGDMRPDVVVHNWLNNEDVFYFGLGGLQFSEQSALSYGTDSTTTLFEDVNEDGTTDAVVFSTQYQSLLVYLSDGLGNFVREQTMSLLGTVSSISMTSFSRNRMPDILMTNNTTPQFSLLLNKNDGSYYDEIVFGVPYTHFGVMSEDVNGDGHTDVVCFDDDTSRYTVYWNQQTDGVSSAAASIAVGRNPNNLFVSDINIDGKDDILVSNGGSHTVSILYGQSRNLSSQISVESPDKPSSVILYAKTDSALTFITSHIEDAKIGITAIKSAPGSTAASTGEIESYTISLSGRPSNVLPDISLRSVPLSLYVFLRGEPNAIVFYQQLHGTQFIAKSLTPLIPSRITYSTISDLNSDGYTDLVYVYNDNRTNKDLLGVTLNDANGEFTGTTYTLTLPDTGYRRSYLLVEDMNSDQLKDYLFYSIDSQTLYVIAGKANGEFTHLYPVSDQVAVSNQDQIQLYDVDTDGVVDIVYYDSSAGQLYWLRNKGNGTYYPKRGLIQFSNTTGFRCGDFDGNGTTDTVFLHPEKHTIEVHYDIGK